MSAHTPGPWEAVPLESIDGPHVPGCYKVRHTGSRQWVASQVTPRDASLIAAAPEMLEALKRCLTMMTDMTTDEWSKGGDRPIRELVTAVIRKAEGE